MESYGETLEIRYPQNTWGLIYQADIGSDIQWVLIYKRKSFCWKMGHWMKTSMTVLSHLTYACLRESMRTWDMGHDESHLVHGM